MLDLPRSARLVLWGNACLTGRAAPDAAVRAVTGTDEPHRIAGEHLPITADPGLADWLDALTPGTVLGLALPVPGDVSGVPPEASAAAVEAGEAVTVTGADGTQVLVPRIERFGSDWEPGAVVTWQSRVTGLVGGALAVMGPGEAARRLRAATGQAATLLHELGVSGYGPVPADLGRTVRAPVAGLPPGLQPRTVDLLEQTSRILAVLELAKDGQNRFDHADAVGGWQADRRRQVLVELAGTARNALVAACVPAGYG